MTNTAANNGKVATIEPDIKAANEFLTRLDEEAEHFQFQTFTDAKSLREKNRIEGKRDPLAKVLYGSLEEHFEQLATFNKRGAGVFVTVSECHGTKRAKHKVTKVRAVWIEDDGDGKLDSVPFEPSMVIETSKGHKHLYFLTETDQVDEFEPVQQRIVDDYGSDPNAKDRARVLRVPGFFHMKDPANPFMVRIVEDNGALPYSWETIKAKFPPVYDTPTKRPQTTPATTHKGPELTQGQFADLESALACIPMDNREEWVTVGMALKGVGNQPKAKRLWVKASQKSDKWDAASEAEWDTFEPNGSIGYASVFSIAEQYGWQNPAKRSSRQKSKVEPIRPGADATPESVQYLLDRFYLIWPTKTAFDLKDMRPVEIAALRLGFPDLCKLWEKHPDRVVINERNIVFDPQRPTGFVDGYLSLFKGMASQPKPGECGRFLRLLNHLCGGRVEVIEYLLGWMAYPLKHPGAKMNVSVLVKGPHGTGKNMLFEYLVAIYGPDHARTIGQDQLESRYNDWASRMLFIIGDEVVSRKEMIHSRGRLKSMITGSTIQIESKFMPMRTEDNRANFVFLSNEPKPLPLEEGDRRYFVIHTPPPLDPQFYSELAKERDNGGIDALHHHLLHNVDLSKFDPHTPALMTPEKQELIGLVAMSPDAFVAEWADGNLNVPYGPARSNELFKAYRRWADACGERAVPQRDFMAALKLRWPASFDHSGRLPRKWAKDLMDKEKQERVMIPEGVDVPANRRDLYIKLQEFKDGLSEG